MANKVALIAGLVTLVCLIALAISSTQRVFEAQVEVKTAQEEVNKATAEAKQAKKELEQTLTTATSNHEGIAKAYSVYQLEFKEKYPEFPGTESWPESWQQIMNRLWPGELN